MSEKVLKYIHDAVKEIQLFIEADEPWKVPLNDKSLSEQEVMNEYAKFINYDNILTSHMKTVDYLIFTLSQTKLGITSNTPNGHKVIGQINAQIEILRFLRKTLDDINDGHYLVGKYFEKGGGMY